MSNGHPAAHNGAKRGTGALPTSVGRRAFFEIFTPTRFFTALCRCHRSSRLFHDVRRGLATKNGPTCVRFSTYRVRSCHCTFGRHVAATEVSLCIPKLHATYPNLPLSRPILRNLVTAPGEKRARARAPLNAWASEEPAMLVLPKVKPCGIPSSPAVIIRLMRRLQRQDRRCHQTHSTNGTASMSLYL